MRTAILLIVMFLSLLSFQISGGSSQSKEQFEYLVVSLPAEKTYVTDTKPPNNPPQNPFGPEAFKQRSFHESVEQEYILDFFGRDGWRLTNIVGMIGGDKLYYFERKK